MGVYVFVSDGPEETRAFAGRLAGFLRGGDVLALEGDLGAGKTTFTQGLAAGLGVKRNVNSPTFTIIKEYAGRLPLYHMDVYRVEDAFEDLGFDEYFEGDGVTVVEWAHLIEAQLPENLLFLKLYLEDNGSRRIVAEPRGKRYVELCEEIF